MTLINAMRTDLPVVDPQGSLAAAASRFTETGYCSLPVVHHGRLVGALNALDVIGQVATAQLDPERSDVASLMREHPLTCAPEASLAEARELMIREGATTLFVTESGPRLVGIIDLVTLLGAAQSHDRAGPESQWDQRVRGDAL